MRGAARDELPELPDLGALNGHAPEQLLEDAVRAVDVQEIPQVQRVVPSRAASSPCG